MKLKSSQIISSMLITFFLLFINVSFAYATGWTTTGTTNTYSFNFASGKFSTGEVYLLGGESQTPSPVYTNLVDRYNPGTNNWTARANMLKAKYMHTANIVVASGAAELLLVVGGRGGLGGYPGSILNSAELYNPANNTWTYTSTTMHFYHAYHTSTVLDDGKVLVVGGRGIFTQLIGSVDIYDPGNNVWSLGATMSAARANHTAVKLNDGRVMVIGGLMKPGSSEVATTSSMFYDPGTNSWSNGPSLNTVRNGHQSVLLSDGRVLVMGGNNGGAISSTEIWDPSSPNAWTTVDSMNNARYNFTATLMSNGYVLVTGGGTGTTKTTAEIYDPTLDTWTATNSISSRASHNAQLLNNGNILIMNGFGVSGPVNTAEYYTP